MEKIKFAQLIGMLHTWGCRPLERHEILTLDAMVSPPEFDRQLAEVNVDTLNQLMKAIGCNQKIEAIKAYRTLTGMGLKESKDAVETYAIRQTKTY